MGKKLLHTPNSRIRSALRQLFLRSREHAAALKAQNRTCAQCGAKASKAKGREVDVRVHHLDPIDWEAIFRFIRETLLCKPERLQVLCEEHHKKLHEEENEK